jgi:hypothetical protein
MSAYLFRTFPSAHRVLNANSFPQRAPATIATFPLRFDRETDILL